MLKAVYAGTFDPITNGHMDIIKRASQLYDVLYVTMFSNPEKNTLFTLDERLAMVKEATKDIKNVIVDASDELAVEYARRVGTHVLVRGLRATQDYHYESLMAYTNQYLDEGIEMVFLMTRLSYTFLSSSAVKEIASHHKDVDSLVPEVTAIALKKKYEGE